jgi:hypothetical protein
MGTAVAEKTRFTCLVMNDEFVSLMTTTPGRADKRVGYEGELIIQGTAGDIKARRVRRLIPLNGALPLRNVREELEEGTICTITVGDPVRITGATYCGVRRISGDTFLAFTKNDISFWLWGHANAFLKT